MSKTAAVKAFTAEQEKVLRGWTACYPYPIMGLIEAMRQVQQWHLCIKPEDEAFLAELFKTTRTHVHGVATFFPYFTQKPTGRQRIGLCHGLSCAMAGSDKMAGCLETKLGVKEKQTTKDGQFSWEEMECLGACDFAPALIVNEKLKGKATDEMIQQVMGKQSRYDRFVSIVAPQAGHEQAGYRARDMSGEKQRDMKLKRENKGASSSRPIVPAVAEYSRLVSDISGLLERARRTSVLAVNGILTAA